MATEGPRAIRQEELRSAHELQGMVFGGRGPRPDWEPPQMSAEQLERRRVCVDDGRVVSIVSKPENEIVLLGAHHRVCCFGGVGTLPEYRGRGLATQLLVDSKQKARENGCDLALISGARGLYLRQGYVDVGGYYVCTVEGKRMPPDAGYTLRPWEDRDVHAVARVYSAERVRWVRSPQFFRGRLRSRSIAVVRGETQVVVRPAGGEPVGYIAYQIGGPRWDPKPESLITVADVGGPRWALVQGLHRLMEQRGIDSVRFKYLSSDCEMAELARTHRWPVEPRPFRGTVGIIGPELFWERSRPTFEERLGAAIAGGLRLTEGDTIRIELGDEALELDGMRALTRLVFLPARRRGELDLDLPADSELRAVLDRLFPLPLVDYGFNHA